MENEVKCPHCGAAIKIDESGYADIVRQVRDAEFNKAVEDRMAVVEQAKADAVALAQAEAQRDSEKLAAEKDALILKLEAEVKALADRNASDSQSAKADLDAKLAAADAQAKVEQAEVRESLQKDIAEKDALIAQLEASLKDEDSRTELAVKKATDELASANRELELKLATAEQSIEKEKDVAVSLLKAEMSAEVNNALAEVERLKRELELQGSQAASSQELAIAKAMNDAAEQRRAIESERDKAREDLRVAKAEAEAAEANQRQEYAIKLRAKEEEILERDRTIETIRNMRLELSNKMLGENLEQFCENEFNKIRATAFQNAEFGKDNDASGGSKGDYIYRELDADGNEIVSIMFEMKTEASNSQEANKKKNSDHFAKLDRDRKAKKCEYAVLVSELESDNDYYDGIVDVSYQSGFDKMYVIRPKSFISMITLLRNAAMQSVGLRQELEAVRQRDLDVTHFEEKLDDFKDKFSDSCRKANDNFAKAIKDIDDTIKKLEKIREALRKSGGHLDAAENKLTKLTRKSLCYKNETARAAFKEYDEKLAAGLVEPYVAEPADDIDDADVIEVEAYDEVSAEV